MTPLLVLKLILCVFPNGPCGAVNERDGERYFSSRSMCENAALQTIWDGFDAGYRVRSAECNLVWVTVKTEFGTLPPTKAAPTNDQRP